MVVSPQCAEAQAWQTTDLHALLDHVIAHQKIDPNRIAILVRLAECCRPCSVSEIAACCPVNISVVSRHLTTLRDAGVLEAEKRGRHVYYSVATLRLVQSLRAIADALEACCPVPDDTDQGV